MSLINEALQKARLEAARQEAEAAGEPWAPAPSHLPQRGGSKLPIWLAGLGLTVGAIGIALAVGSRAPSASVSEPAAAEPVVARAAITAPPAAVTTASPRATEPEPGAARPARPAPSAPAPEPAPARPLTGEAESPSTEPSVMLVLPEAGSRPARQRTRGPQEDGAAAAPRGGLELDGIAWAETGPFAVINGQIVGEGDRIAGQTVERIEPRRVEIRGDSGSFYIDLK